MADPSSEPVRPGQQVRNLFSGETLTFRRTSAETNGELIELDVDLRPLGAPGGAPHRHRVTERFRVTSGAVLAWVGLGAPRLVRAGDYVDVPPGRWHFLLAVGSAGARVTIEPGMRFDELLVDWAGLGSGDLRPSLIRRIVPLLRQHGCL